MSAMIAVAGRIADGAFPNAATPEMYVFGQLGLGD
jgi:hypothetical protein